MHAHFQNMFQSANPASPNIKFFDVEFNFIEERSKQIQKATPCTEAEQPYNVDKNRWPDVLPPDSTRVRLNPIPGVIGSDYINASFIMSSNGDKQGYVCSQGPMENTIDDFWRLVWDHKIRVFSMLTKEVEKNQVKSARYWPSEKDKPTVYGKIEVTLISENQIEDEFIIREFTVIHQENLDDKRSMIHFQYTGWPDHGIPSNTKHFIDLMDRVDTAIKERGGPIGLHCSAGIGRTGTFCAVHININILREHFKKHNDPPPLNLVNTILLLRKQRPGMVQTKEQFFFCYKSILDVYIKLTQEGKARKQLLLQQQTAPTTTPAPEAAPSTPTPTPAPETSDTSEKLIT
uniref:Protein-tyrosine-phosphatase n=1 Tax=Arcella intermedia TaxID=1963864 RepID=A0A6B2L976_9EUKA